MKIYKISQNNNKESFSVWLAKKLLSTPIELTGFHTRLLKKWIEETNPDLQKNSLLGAISKAKEWMEEQTTSIKSLKPEDITMENKQDMADILSYLYGQKSSPVKPNEIRIIHISQPLSPLKPFHVDVEYIMEDYVSNRYHTFATKDGKIFGLAE